jgi:hypothetical protein
MSIFDFLNNSFLNRMITPVAPIDINQTNNTINILQINPFGLEDVREIPVSEMILILNSGDNAGLHIIKAIFLLKSFFKSHFVIIEEKESIL